MNCKNCGIEFDGRADAKFCSPRCRVTFNRKASIVTDNVTFSEPDVTDNFEFYTETTDRKTPAGKVPGERSPTKSVKYWYDVPLGAIPVIKKGWPPMPDYMNGRQYFLWWKNNFEVGKGKDPFDGPVLHNPYPKYDNVTYKQGKGPGA